MRGRFGLLLVLTVVLGVGVGCAAMGGSGMSAEEMARSHWAAISKNQLAETTSGYSDASTLDWVGGPLNGKYQGKSGITGVWTKFFAVQGPLTVDISNVQVKDDYGKSTVTARTIWKGKATVPVDYTLVYDGGTLVAETWKIRP